MLRSVVILAAAMMVCAALTRPAAARSAGIVGYSGKDDFFCTECHDMGDRTGPTVRFIDVPTQVEPGAVVTVQFGVHPNSPGLIAGGFNVASSAGDLQLGSDSGVRRSRLTPTFPFEVTHTEPRDFVDGEAVWSFTWTAPQTPGEYILFGAGNSVDFSFDEQGDAAAKTMIVVQVGSGVETTPTATPTVTPTMTSGPATCGGDCDGDGSVAINELVAGVNIALGSAALSTCPSFDSSGDGSVAINELLSAVSHLLNGC
ncbi:MAG: choice-of-anchor V domain-containing protein [bacterium]